MVHLEIQQVLKKGNEVISLNIDLSNTVLEDAEYKSLGKYLQQKKHLANLSINLKNSKFGKDGVANLMSGFSGLKKVKYLTLYIELSNDQEMLSLQEGLAEMSDLEELDLNVIFIPQVAQVEFAEFLPELSNLKYLRINSNVQYSNYDRFVDILSGLTQLAHLYLDLSSFYLNGILTFGKILNQVTSLQSLNLTIVLSYYYNSSKERIDEIKAEFTNLTLKNLKKLNIIFDFEFRQITNNEQFELICQGFEQMIHCRSINISCERILEKEALLKYLAPIHNLTYLQISVNNFRFLTIYQEHFKTFNQNSLLGFDFRKYPITISDDDDFTEFMKNLAKCQNLTLIQMNISLELIKMEKCIYLAKALSRLPSFRVLNVDINLSKSYQDKFQESLFILKGLTVLNLSITNNDLNSKKKSVKKNKQEIQKYRVSFIKKLTNLIQLSLS